MPTYWTLTHFIAHGPVGGSCGHRHTTYAAAKSCAKRLRKRHERFCAEHGRAWVYDRVAVGVWTDERGYTRLDTDGRCEGQEATG